MLCCRSWRSRIEEHSALVVACYDGDLVGVIEGKVGVDEDADVSDGRCQWQLIVKCEPCVGVCVKDNH